ncbi:unnamed protein product [Amoebophrya sp. A25]|nr:unnamed protein product [Amoebophrya sp. A25]|eukprot:GSA25T00014992001.1
MCFFISRIIRFQDTDCHHLLMHRNVQLQQLLALAKLRLNKKLLGRGKIRST